MRKFYTVYTTFLILCWGALAVTQFTGCTSPNAQVASYKTIASVQASVAAARDAFLVANAHGLVSDADKTKAVELSTKFNDAFNRAIRTAKLMDAPAPMFLEVAASEFLLFAAQFMTK